MSLDEQRIAIAEACGWTAIEVIPAWFVTDCETSKVRLVGNPPHAPFDNVAKKWRWTIPDYLNDLNAMHTAVLSVLNTSSTPRFGFEYINHLQAITKAHAGISVALIEATATQRAEAFLRTIEKWK